jgi:hypothetical protein
MRRSAGTHEKQRGDDNKAARHAMLAKLTAAAVHASAWDWPAAALANPMRMGHRRPVAGTAGCCRQGPPCSTSNPHSTNPRGLRICHRAEGAARSCVGGSWGNRRRRGLCAVSCRPDNCSTRVRLLSDSSTDDAERWPRQVFPPWAVAGSSPSYSPRWLRAASSPGVGVGASLMVAHVSLLDMIIGLVGAGG